MHFKKLYLLAPVVVLSLTSCGSKSVRYKIEDYCLSYNDMISKRHSDFKASYSEFNILQLSDLHMGMMDDFDYHMNFVKETIEQTNEILKEKNNSNSNSGHIDLIIITGDVFTFSDKRTVYELCDFFESQKIPWTLTFGNHDEQAYYSVDWLTSYLTNLSKRDDSYLLFKDMPDDDVFGNANFVIDLDSDSESSNGVNRQIVMLDSNRYNYGEGYGYDYIHYDQIDWYNRVVDYFQEKYSNGPKSLCFFHIPLPEYRDAFNDAQDDSKSNASFINGKLYIKGDKEKEVTREGDKDTSDGAPKVNTHFFDALLKSNYVKGTFVGHAHTNTYCVDYNNEGKSLENNNSVALCYGVKSTDRVYCDYEMLGGQLITFYDSSKDQDNDSDGQKGSDWFDVDLIYHKYA